MKFLLLISLLAAGSLEAAAQPLPGKVDGLDSMYADWLSHVLQRWSPKRFDGESALPLALTCIATASEEKYVGMLQRTTIRAGISVVENILDDVAHYKDLFPGTVDVQVVPGSRDGNRFVTAWEQRVPVFFLPNVTYELDYLVDKTTPGRVVYRYKLRRGGKLTASDGMVVLDAVGPATTQFTEYDFFNARWGPLPTALVWRESLQGAFLSDVAIKLKAENPIWSYERIASEAERLIEAEAERMEQCFSQRQNADLRDAY
jgi:hypothetical protein